jgi:uncharacterized RDD family membrane protein YckC
VDLDESITIATPEGIELRLQLAGLGSRFIAGGVDLIIQLILIAILLLITASSGISAVVSVIGLFVITLFYPILFELLAAGRTPGKRLSHMRVLRDSGAPIDLPASAIRNLMRLVDGPTLLYLPTLVSIAVTSRNQRPGDLAAGTIVIREDPPRRSKGKDADAPPPAEESSTGAGAFAERWDTSAVTARELAAVRQFLERRSSLERGARRELAKRLAEGLRPKVSSAPADLDSERFLEELERIKRVR